MDFSVQVSNFILQPANIYHLLNKNVHEWKNTKFITEKVKETFKTAMVLIAV